ncbi:MAG: phytanoyl-CoA dioxygenase family protein [Polyangiaceae bacterium]|nr:phytanoyl-CoA dioxygenase family protein [Polyangiaceae bacterium]
MLLSQVELDAYQADGYLHVPRMLNPEETALLLQVASENQVARRAREAVDAQGQGAKVNIWDHVQDDMFGAIASSRRIVERGTQLVGEEIYHWHSKMMLKDPGTGAWEWHQDYGYWYGACLYPSLVSCFIAVHPATKANGCLQVLRGSHRAGRIDHGVVNGQQGADPARVEQLAMRHERVYVELEPGSALFFHPNLLHRSDANSSENPRWALICCYNARSNSRFDGRTDAGHPPYSPISVLLDSEVLEAGKREPGRLKERR